MTETMNAALTAILKMRSSAMSDPCAVLNVAPGMPAVTMETPVHEARRNYMRLAALVHPDKFTGKPDLQASATEAFQLLVRVFELVAAPDFRKKAAAKKAANEKRRAAAGSKASAGAASDGGAGGTGLVKGPSTRGTTKRKTSQDSDEEESSSESDEDDDETIAAAAAKKRPAKEVITRNRTNDGCRRTTVKCPRCTTAWQPDDNKQYTLFMGYGLKIHCQLCLLLFGCAAAGHACPRCDAPFEYDTSMYDDRVKCKKCSSEFGFMFYPITGDHINKIREAEAEEEAKRRNAAEREERARARVAGGSGVAAAKANSTGGGSATTTTTTTAAAGKTPAQGIDEEAMLTLIGKCVIDEACPLCGKRVASKHRAHVELCAKNPPPPKKERKVRKFILNDGSDSDDDDGKKSKKRKKATATAKAPSAGRGLSSKPSAGKRRRRDDDDDDD